MKQTASVTHKQIRGVFWTIPNLFDEAFFENKKQLKAFDNSREKSSIIDFS